MSDLLDQLKDSNEPLIIRSYLLAILAAPELLGLWDDSTPQRVIELRRAAAVDAAKMAFDFLSEGFSFQQLVLPFLNKKLNFIRDASTQADILQIFKLQNPALDGDKYVNRHPYPIAEEELMCWRTAIRENAPNRLHARRINELMVELFGTTAYDLAKDGDDEQDSGTAGTEI